MLILLCSGGIGAVAVGDKFTLFDELREHAGHGCDLDALCLRDKQVVLLLRQAVRLRRFVKAHTHRRGAAARRRQVDRIAVGLIRSADRHADVEVDGVDRAGNGVFFRRRPIVPLGGDSRRAERPIRRGDDVVARLRSEVERARLLIKHLAAERRGDRKHARRMIAAYVERAAFSRFLEIGKVGQHYICSHYLRGSICGDVRRKSERHVAVLRLDRHGYDLDHSLQQPVYCLVGGDQRDEVAFLIDGDVAHSRCRVDDGRIRRVFCVGGLVVISVEIDSADHALAVGQNNVRRGIAVIILLRSAGRGLGIDDQRDAVRNGTASAGDGDRNASVVVEGDVADCLAAAADDTLDERARVITDVGACDLDLGLCPVNCQSDLVRLRLTVIDDLFD